ncbi:hypothetical protein POVWA2_020180 [Plasmodium ovale wallikeri]|uniref:Uncharacterized protein n=1 Tax=Plasmodium ovale wallikeri TaxID=864142 RepID=A0A1A8YQV4_PLAOA|nr:hypothetical protein POVWA1_019990 [Plasmodium ovale wallikeri]SBT34529.1 hypothetical protein POVWA2_020180 [Plasmodium ovale wallikeri]
MRKRRERDAKETRKRRERDAKEVRKRRERDAKEDNVSCSAASYTYTCKEAAHGIPALFFFFIFYMIGRRYISPYIVSSFFRKQGKSKVCSIQKYHFFSPPVCNKDALCICCAMLQYAMIWCSLLFCAVLCCALL